MAWPAIIIGIIVLFWLLHEKKQNELYPPEMREHHRQEAAQRALDKRLINQRIARVKRARKDPKYYEELKRFDPTFYVPTEEEWRESPAGKEEARRASQTAMYAVLTIFFLLTIFAASD